MKSNFSTRFAKSHYAFEIWMTKQYSKVFSKNGLKSLNARKWRRKMGKILMRKGENIIAPLELEED